MLITALCKQSCVKCNDEDERRPRPRLFQISSRPRPFKGTSRDRDFNTEITSLGSAIPIIETPKGTSLAAETALTDPSCGATWARAEETKKERQWKENHNDKLGVRTDHPCCRSNKWFCVPGGLREVITSFKFSRNRLNSFWDMGGFLLLRPVALYYRIQAVIRFDSVRRYIGYTLQRVCFIVTSTLSIVHGIIGIITGKRTCHTVFPLAYSFN